MPSMPEHRLTISYMQAETNGIEKEIMWMSASSTKGAHRQMIQDRSAEQGLIPGSLQDDLSESQGLSRFLLLRKDYGLFINFLGEAVNCKQCRAKRYKCPPSRVFALLLSESRPMARS